MKKIINSPDNVVDEMLQGFVLSNLAKLRFSKGSSKAIVKKKLEDKVGVVIGGGSGHEPMFMGYVGDGLADAVANGNVFAAPTPETILSAIKEVDCGKGVVCIFGNYSGDVLNFEMAKELAEIEDIKVENIIVRDDIASASLEEKENRRGIAGDLYMIKLIGAASQMGYSFEECIQLGEKINNNLFSVGVGFSPGTHPANGEPGFYLDEGMMEFGLGIHGEPGIEQRPITSSEDICKMLVNFLLEEIGDEKENEISMCVNGLGSTTLLELYIVAKDAANVFESNNCKMMDVMVGSFCTTQEMGGLSISALILDDEFKKLLEKKAVSSNFHKGV